jgi:hypothetical protein
MEKGKLPFFITAIKTKTKKIALMKTTIIILAASFMICLNNNLSAQNNAGVNAKVTESFGKHYEGATNISWHKAKGMDIALFQYEQKTCIAYFNMEGDVVAGARRIREISNLPLKVQNSLVEFKSKKSAKEGPVTLGPIFEVLDRDGRSYYFTTMEGSGQKLSVSINNDGYTTIEKKETRGPVMLQTNDRNLLAKQK